MNSFSNPYCLIANSSIDFKDGVILCELVSALKGAPVSGAMQNSFAGNSTDTSLNNIQIALNELKTCPGLEIPTNIFEMSAEDVYDSEEKLFDLLEFLRSAFSSKSKPAAEMEDDRYFAAADEVQRDGYIGSDRKSVQAQISSQANFIDPFQTESGNCNPEPAEIPTKPIALQQSEDDALMRMPEKAREIRREEEDRPLQMAGFEQAKKKEKTDIKVKQKVLGWLEQISLIKHGVVKADDFPGYCRNGVLISDLIVRLEGVRN